MSKPTSDDRIANERENWALRKEALEKARQRLKEEKEEFPIWDGRISYEAYYIELRKYGAKESKYMLEALRELEAHKKPIKNEVKSWAPYKDQE